MSEDFVLCPVCGKEYRILQLQHLRTHGYKSREEFLKDYPGTKLCSSYFSQKSKETMGKRWKDPKQHKTASLKAKEQFTEYYSIPSNREKTSQIRKKCWESKSYREATTSARWTKEQRKLQSDRIRREDLRRLSDPDYYNKVCDLLLTYKSIKYYYTNRNGTKLTLRSSWEHRVVTFLDANLIEYEWESLKIDYFDPIKSKMRKYIPDLYLPNTNTVIEIKPTAFLNNPVVIAKAEACKNLGYGFRFLTELDLDNLDEYFS